jgi:hypothetical protein
MPTTWSLYIHDRIQSRLKQERKRENDKERTKKKTGFFPHAFKHNSFLCRMHLAIFSFNIYHSNIYFNSN